MFLTIMVRSRSATAVRPRGAYLQIGEVAERTGVTQRTLRFYEEKELLKPPSELEGGFRLYSEEDVRRVERIKQLQRLLGFTLAEIKEMVEAEEVQEQLLAEDGAKADPEERRRRITRARELTERQDAVIRGKVDGLLEMKSRLEGKLRDYRAWLQELDA
jgi:DNA-binding transcriptional MerR regulator